MIQRKILDNIEASEDLFLLGVVSLEKDELAYKRYLNWLKCGNHAGMTYMENHKNLRHDPSLLLPDAKSCLVLGYNYNLGDKLSHVKKGPLIAQYARLKDYHKFLRKEASSFAEKLKQLYPDLQYRVLVDSAPLLEKSLAAKTKLGFIGKNSLFIHPKLGSLFFLCEILVDHEVVTDVKAPVDPDKRSVEFGGCGTCRRCASFCPTGALDQDYVLDSSKCLSYYTIEHRDTIPLKYWPFLVKYLYGCDLCQLVCPYNRKAPISKTPYKVFESATELFSVATMDQEFYEKTFGGTPMVRAKKQGLQRNALIAMVVSSDKRLSEALDLLKSGETHPLVLKTIEQIPAYLKQNP